MVKALLADGGFKVRAVTRNPDSAKAKALSEQGSEVVKVDMDDKESRKPGHGPGARDSAGQEHRRYL